MLEFHFSSFIQTFRSMIFLQYPHDLFETVISIGTKGICVYELKQFLAVLSSTCQAYHLVKIYGWLILVCKIKLLFGLKVAF